MRKGLAWAAGALALLAAGAAAQTARVGRPGRIGAAADARAATVDPRAVAAVVAAQPEAEPKPLLVQRAADRRLLLKGDLATRRGVQLYRTSKDVLFEVSVSPGSRYTAAIESIDGEVVDGEYVVPPRNELVILDADGRVVRRVEQNVQRYLFSPDEKQVAYIVGRYYEGGVGFLPEGAFVLDIATGATQPIEADDPYELSWAANERESSVLLRVLAEEPRRKVLSYDLRRRRVSAVASGAFHVSPDGSHYLKQPYELIEEGTCRSAAGGEPCFEVRDRRTGQPAPKPPAALGKVAGWAADAGHALLLTREQRSLSETPLSLGRATLRRLVVADIAAAETTVWDVSTRQVVETVKGLPVVAATPETWVTGQRTLLLAKPATGAARSSRELEQIFVKPRRPASPP